VTAQQERLIGDAKGEFESQQQHAGSLGAFTDRFECESF
jgi:hypothetical protein